MLFPANLNHYISGIKGKDRKRMGFIPIMMDFQNKEVVIVGGGKVAKKRLQQLANTGAYVTIVSPDLLPELQELHELKVFTWKNKEFQAEDVSDAHVIIIATNNPSVNQYVTESAPKTAFVNHTENAERGNLIFPASLQRGKLTVSISTGGASPYLASNIKNQFESMFDDQYGIFIDFLYECRGLLKKSSLSHEERIALLTEILKDEYRNTEKQKEILTQLKTTRKGHENERAFK
jgi:precorrin-2 dehydrogenase/sirohydrochlorin ferrochelatase